MTLEWTFSTVLSIAASDREAKSLAVWNGLIWALTNETNPVSGDPSSGRIYYSQNGDDWTEDAAWEGPAYVDSGGYWGGQLFVHQNVLHLLCNNTINDGRVYRRIDGVWQLLFSENIGSDLRYLFAHSNDTWIVVCGTDFSPVGKSEGVIWVWDGTSKTEEFHADSSGYPYDDAAWRPIYYNNEWYAWTNRWLDASTHQRILRYRGDGSWPSFVRIYSGPATDVVYLCVNLFGLLWGDDLWGTDGDWTNVAFSGDTGASYYHGSVITAKSSIWEGSCYTYDGTDWIYRGEVEDLYRTDLYCFQHHGGQLYVAGAYGSGPKVYRITVNHTATLGPWAKPTARTIVCDHEVGDTLYLAVYKEDGEPIAMRLDPANFEWWEKIFDLTSSGSLIGVNTAGERDTCHVFGYFGVNEQIWRTDDWGHDFSDNDDDWGTDKVPTLEYHPLDGEDLVATQYTAQDLLQTLTGLLPWSDIGDIPILPRCQMRVQDDVWIGSDTAVASPVQMYSSGSWADKSNGLPSVAINDMELGF
jgi:hypothetical protein